MRVDWLWNISAGRVMALRAVFQSLVRVDWLWNSMGAELVSNLLLVSIPRAG